MYLSFEALNATRSYIERAYCVSIESALFNKRRHNGVANPDQDSQCASQPPS